MTNSIPAQATHTNTHQVAVSLKTQAGSPKPDISKSVLLFRELTLSSLPLNKINKSDRKTIALLLEIAHSIHIKNEVLDQRDSWNEDSSKVFEKELFMDWFEREFSVLRLKFNQLKGRLVQANFSVCHNNVTTTVTMSF